MSTKSMRAGSVTLNVGPLKALSADLKKYGKYRVHVGIWGPQDIRAGLSKGPTDPRLGNAEIGTIQEFGSIENNIPERSFLRVPLMSYLPDAIRTAGQTSWRNSILKDGMLKTLKKLGQLGTQVVDDAFWTRGFGMWAPNAKRTIKAKGSDAPLIDGGELRQAVQHRTVAP